MNNPGSRLDACPRCYDRVLNAPVRIVSDRADGFTAAYACTACGHRWHTSWNHE